MHYAYTKYQVIIGVFLLIFSGLGSVNAATGYGAFDIRNENPIYAVYGLPIYGSTHFVTKYQWQHSVLLDWSNIYYQNPITIADESLILDGETVRLTYQLNQAFTDQLKWAISVPYISHGEGKLDGFINDWHDAFHFADHGRDDAPIGEYLIEYSRDGELLLHVDQPSEGVGDVQFALRYSGLGQTLGSDDFGINASLKLPTGDSDVLLGSGHADLAVWLDGKWRASLYDFPSSVFLSAGLLYMSGTDILPELHQSIVGFGRAGIAVGLTDTLAFKMQIDGHTPFYTDTDIKALDGYGVQVTTGGQWNISPRSSLDFAVVEDINVGVSPDVVFHIAYRFAN